MHNLFLVYFVNLYMFRAYLYKPETFRGLSKYTESKLCIKLDFLYTTKQSTGVLLQKRTLSINT